ncbi:MAG TPA: fibro-slime domain-containing protein [Fibrobacteria bacterium]|nr:fibro-slime domain-containing protein [Fibrobacteria bacterium]
MTHPAPNATPLPSALWKTCLVVLALLGGVETVSGAPPTTFPAPTGAGRAPSLSGTLYDYRMRDLRGLDTSVYFPFAFGSPYGEIPGLLQSRLSPNGRPVWSGVPLCKTHPDPARPCEDSLNAPDRWFSARAGKNLAIPLELPLEAGTGDSLGFLDSFFFPLDAFRFLPGGLLINPFFDQMIGQDLEIHDFGFCLELHARVQPRDSGRLTITGDDDTWVFVDGEIAVDMGGLHPATTQRIALAPRQGKTDKPVALDIFHCERMPNESVFGISLNVPVLPSDSVVDTLPISGRLREPGAAGTLSLRQSVGTLAIDVSASQAWTLELRDLDGRLQRSLSGMGPATTPLTNPGISVALLRSGTETITGRFVHSR